MWCWLWISSPVINLPCLVKLPQRDLRQSFWVPFGGSVSRQIRGVQRKAFPLHLLFFKYLQLKIINILTGHFWGGMPWTPTVIFWGSIFCYLSVRKRCLEECLDLREGLLVETGCCCFGKYQIEIFDIWGNKSTPGGAVDKTLRSRCRGPRFHPWSGN